MKMRPVSFSLRFFLGGLLPQVKHRHPRACGNKPLAQRSTGIAGQGKDGVSRQRGGGKRWKSLHPWCRGCDMHMEGGSRVYIPLYPVQRFPANKQVMKNSESYVSFLLCI